MENKEQDLMALLKEIFLLQEAARLQSWDELTGMPAKAAGHRSEVTSYLSSKAFEKEIGSEMAELVAYFTEHPEELSSLGKEVFAKVKEDYEEQKNIPIDLMEEINKETSKAYAKWIEAREQKDFSIFQPALEKIIVLKKKLIPYLQKAEKTPYDVLLNQYEPGMTTETLDAVFAKVRTGIMEIRQALAEKGIEPRTDFLKRFVSKEQQETFVRQVTKELGYDYGRGRLDNTVHPFMEAINRNDARITTRWDEHNFTMATFGVIHEAGHGMYEQNIDEKYDYTPLSEGTSMGIHESQSLFNEIIVGSSKAFWQKQYPYLQEVTGDTFKDIDFTTFYRGLKKSEASLVRVEADTLTYVLHIIIRYEIEKLIFNENIDIATLPTLWNDKYEEYLGIRPENDLEGILQDVHWSGGDFGYFPSYALGYMYAAQLHHAMQKEIDTEAVLASNDYQPIRKWLTKHIHQYGASRKPNQLIKDATGELLNPEYLLTYLRKLYFEVYQVKA